MDEIERINSSSISHRIVVTRQIFLKGLSLVYLIAFFGLFGQIQGLWGDEGILPVSLMIKKMKKEDLTLFGFPTLAIILRKIPFPSSQAFGSYAQNYLYILCIIGIAISALILMGVKRVNTTYFYLVMFYCYLNFVLLGNIFTKYDWDYLLLEAGFLAIIFAPRSSSQINIISTIDNIALYLLRFTLFKVLVATGTNLMTSGCPYWVSFTGLNFYFQSVPLLSSFSFTAHNLPEGIKKLLSSLTIYSLMYIPYGFFFIWRRFNIFCGEIIFIFNIFVMLTANYSFFNLLLIVINVVNFDDYFWRGVIGNKLLEKLELDNLRPIVEQFYAEKKIKDEQDEMEYQKEQAERERLTNKLKEAKTAEEKAKIEEEIKDLIRNRKWNFYDMDDGPRIEESIEPTTKPLNEVFFFLNFFAVMILVVFFYVFPIKNLLQGTIFISDAEPENISFFNPLLYIFIYIVFVIFYDLSFSVKALIISSLSLGNLATVGDLEKETQKPSSFMSKIKSLLYYSGIVLKYILVIILFSAYYIGGVENFYKGMGTYLIDEEKRKRQAERKPNDLSMPIPPSETVIDLGLSIYSNTLQPFLVTGQYGKVQGRINDHNNARNEIEYEYTTEDASYNWKRLKFMYKTNEEIRPKFLFFYQPRLDYFLHSLAEENDFNKDSTSVVIMGRIFEKNPVILDLLGYEIEDKKRYYKSSMFDKIKNNYLGWKREKFTDNPRTMKADLFLYRMEGNDLLKKREREYIGYLKKFALENFFRINGYPQMNEGKKHISPFQLIPVGDILILGFFIKLLMLTL